MKKEFTRVFTKASILFTLATLLFICGMKLERLAQAQTVPTTLQLTGSAPHTTCAVVASTTNFCFANDGLWESINGAAYVQLTPATATGVISLTVCNAAGTTCGTAQTGAVSLSIPKTATLQ